MEAGAQDSEKRARAIALPGARDHTGRGWRVAVAEMGARDRVARLDLE